MNLDLLRDLVQHTVGLELFDTIRIRGTATETRIDAINKERQMTMEAKSLIAEPEFQGVFAMPSLGRLSAILNIPEYKENAVTKVVNETKNGVDVISGLHFENQYGDFKNDYRFMDGQFINRLWGEKTFPGANWDIEFQPTVVGINKFKYQTQILKEESIFSARIEKGNLYFNLGDPSTYSGDFVFHTGLKGSLAQLNWPIKNVMPIFNLAGTKTMRFSNEGVLMVEVNSGLCIYNFYIMAYSK